MIDLNIALVLVVAALISIYLVWPFSYWKRKGIKYDATLSLFGTVADNMWVRQHMSDLLNGLYTKFKDEPYFGIYTFMRPALVIKDIKLINEITIKKFDYFSDHIIFSTGECLELFGQNLFQAKGNYWKTIRSSLSKAFTSAKIKGMFAYIEECTKVALTSIGKQTSVDEVIVVNPLDLARRFTTDSVASCIFGLQNNSFEDKNNEFFQRTATVSDFGIGNKRFASFGYCFPRFLVELFKLRMIEPDDEEFFSRVFKENIQYRKENGTNREDIMQIMIKMQEEASHSESQENSGLSNESLAAHGLVFVLAGSDTSATAISFAFHELAYSKTIQDKLYEEIQQGFSANDNRMDYDTLRDMQYLDMFFNETLRKWPTLTVTDRVTVKPYVIEHNGKKLTVDQGLTVWIPIFSIHRDPNYYENPEEFDPERFNPENKAKIKTGTFIPFGIGPRICIGNRMAILMFKLLVVHVLKEYEVVPLPGIPYNLKLNKKYILLKTEEPLTVGFRKRKL